MFDTASLMMTLPELVLTAGGLILMMVAAYAGDGAARLVGWLSVATLALAGLGKETSLLAVAGVADVRWREPRTWWRPAATAVIVALALLLLLRTELLVGAVDGAEAMRRRLALCGRRPRG